MCRYSDDDYEICDREKLSIQLHKLATNQTMTTADGQVYVAVKFIQNLEKELKCSI